MTNTFADILEAQQRVLEFRTRSQDVYPWPSDEFCIRFAVTEAAEALSARMDEENLFKRNNPKPEHDVLSELGDCAFMILSVRGLWGVEDLIAYRLPDIAEYAVLSRVINDLSNAELDMYYNEEDRDMINMHLLGALEELLSYPEFDILKYTQKTLDKQTKKHLGG